MYRYNIPLIFLILILITTFTIYKLYESYNTNMKITVIILNYNRPHNLDILIPSLVKIDCIGEIIISHGKKETENIIKQNKVINETKIKNIYYSAARFECIKLAKNNIILFLDDDILITEEGIITLLDSMKKNGTNNLYGPNHRTCDSSGYFFNKANNTILTSCALIGKKTGLKVWNDMKKSPYFNIVLDQKGNGEDIVFSYFLNKNKYGKDIYVDIKTKNLDNTNGYSNKPSHYKERTSLCKTINNKVN